MDTVYGKGKTCLLLLTESFSLGGNNQATDRTQKSVVHALDKLEKRMVSHLLIA
jgi:hypothetical protein